MEMGWGRYGMGNSQRVGQEGDKIWSVKNKLNNIFKKQ
jgi:DNA-binding CsgD family transcriptional regulator